MKLILPFQEVVYPLYTKRVDIDVSRKVGVLPAEDHCGNRSNGMLPTWKSSVCKIYEVLNNCIFASNGNTVLVSMGDFMGLLLSIKTASKYLRIYPIGLCASFPVFIELRTPGNNSALYYLFPARL